MKETIMKWNFSETRMLEEHDFHKSLERFHGFGVSGLIRETLQNSLDHRLDESLPAKITIRTGKISRSNIPGYSQLKDRINSIRGSNEYSKDTIEYMQKVVLDNEDVDFISIEDENTKGLMGADVPYNHLEKNQYSAYAYSRGVHFDDYDTQGPVRGGSHGIGKIAANAASKIFVMFFANCDENNYQTLGGNIQLIDHYYGGKAYRSSGYFTNTNEGQYKALKNQGFNEIFNKSTRGLKIIVPFVRNDYTIAANIIRSVIDGFLLALLNGSLVVHIADKIIDGSNVDTFLKNDGYYSQDYEGMMKNDEVYTPAYYDTLTNHFRTDRFIVKDKKREYKFSLYFQYNSDMPSGRTAIIRNIGMKIDDFKVKNRFTAPYNAVLIPRESDGDSFLKSLENESHTELDSKHFKDRIQKENAAYFIKQLHESLRSVIDEAMDELTPNEDKLNTADIIYEIRDKFEKDLKKTITTVQVSKGKKPKLVKVSPTNEPGLNGKKTKGTGTSVPLKAVKRKFGDDQTKTYYPLLSGRIRRSQSENKETILINLTGFDQFEKVKQANLNISLVDGMGKEHFDELNLNEHYMNIYAMPEGVEIKIEKNRFINIPIINNKLQLECKLKKGRNFTKMKYYLEV